MTNLTYAQLEGVWLQAAAGTQYATDAWAALMAAIAEAESGGNPNATNPTDNNGTQTSWGLWQISNGTHSSVSATWNNPLTNAQLALGKLQSQGLTAWGTYDSGAYKAFLSSSTTPDTNIATLTADTSAAAGASAASAANAAANCAWNINYGLGSVCLLSNSQVRGFAGVGLYLAGALILAVGLAVVMHGIESSIADKITAAVPLAGPAVRGITAATAALGA